MGTKAPEVLATSVSMSGTFASITGAVVPIGGSDFITLHATFAAGLSGTFTLELRDVDNAVINKVAEDGTLVPQTFAFTGIAGDDDISITLDVRGLNEAAFMGKHATCNIAELRISREGTNNTTPSSR